MHVLIVSSGYPNIYAPLDGIFYKDQAEALFLAGHQVGVVSAIPVSIFSFLRTKKWAFGISKKRVNGIPSFTHTYLNKPKSPQYCIKKAKKLGVSLFHDYIQEFGQPDIIHLHCFEGGELALEIQKKYAIPFIVTEHSSRFLLNTVPPLLEIIAKKVYHGARNRIAVSTFLKSTLELKYSIHFDYIPNIVNTKEFNIDHAIEKKEPFTFINVAGLNTNKNHSLLLHAFSLFLKDGFDAKLKIAGTGSLKNQLENEVKELKLNDKVDFLGHKNRDELNIEYNKSHAFVLSSKKETFGVVIIEAMSCGLPIISTKCGGPESIVTESFIGELTDVNAKSLSLGMKKIYEDWRSFDSKSIRLFAETNFSIDAVGKQLTQMYQNIVTKNDN
jgi:L-malate glycosyltransferase